MIAICWSFSIGGFAWAKPKSVVLEDGSRLVGEILSFDTSGCRIQTRNLGIIMIPLEKVVEITPAEADRRPPGTRSIVEAEMMALELQRETQQRAQNAQKQIIMDMMTSNPAMAKAVERLQSMPELIEAIADPSILLAIEMGDIDTLMKNPHIRALLDTETLEALKVMERKNSQRREWEKK